jgi:DNA repair protein RadC
MNKGIKNWALDDRPREKLALKGAESLSSSELLAILINNGSKTKTAVDLAKEVLQLGGNNLTDLSRLTVKDLKKIKGIGEAKAIAIVAALELGRRRSAEQGLSKPKIAQAKDLANFLQPLLQDYAHEVFVAIFLNANHNILHWEVVHEGGLTSTVVDPRMILKKALQNNAVKIAVAHNHPSGSLRPSEADKKLTKQLFEAAKLLDITLIDHLIVAETGYFSFADEGIM